MNIKLICGDCIAEFDKLESESVDMVIADPPYGVTKNKWDSIIPLDSLFKEIRRIIKPSGAVVLFGSGFFTAQLMNAGKILWRYNLIWEKTSPTGFLNANRMPLRAHEDIVVFYKQPPTYNPKKTSGHERKVSKATHKQNCKQSDNYGKYGLTDYDSTERYPRSVLKFSTDKQKKAIHPTQKPVALLEWLIRSYTNPEETVLDFCMGSGSTGIACVNSGRSFIGIEQDFSYFKKAKTRIEEAQIQ